MKRGMSFGPSGWRSALSHVRRSGVGLFDIALWALRFRHRRGDEIWAAGQSEGIWAIRASGPADASVL
ncbi:MAG TPA: hypothetical protein VF288_04945, partial [Mycobacteriales bacterium]